VRAEVEQRYGGSARVVYHDTSRPEVVAAHNETVRFIQDNGLIYPVTVIDGEPVYDGAVSYPAILRAVQTKLASLS
jgi:disulfide oxidoreductase YuzD